MIRRKLVSPRFCFCLFELLWKNLFGQICECQSVSQYYTCSLCQINREHAQSWREDKSYVFSLLCDVIFKCTPMNFVFRCFRARPPTSFAPRPDTIGLAAPYLNWPRRPRFGLWLFLGGRHGKTNNLIAQFGPAFLSLFISISPAIDQIPRVSNYILWCIIDCICWRAF